MNKFTSINCEGCSKRQACFLLDPPYQRLVQDIAAKYVPDYCPCQLCIIKGICNKNCDQYSTSLAIMYDYYQEKWELKEKLHQVEMKRKREEVSKLFL